jgi:hypothetical protein
MNHVRHEAAFDGGCCVAPFSPAARYRITGACTCQRASRAAGDARGVIRTRTTNGNGFPAARELPLPVAVLFAVAAAGRARPGSLLRWYRRSNPATPGAIRRQCWYWCVGVRRASRPGFLSASRARPVRCGGSRPPCGSRRDAVRLRAAARLPRGLCRSGHGVHPVRGTTLNDPTDNERMQLTRGPCTSTRTRQTGRPV